MSEDSTLFYDWKSIKANNRSNSAIIEIFTNLIITRNPMNKKWVGRSYILKPKRLFNAAGITKDEIIQILSIASTRNYFDYWFNGNRSIFLDFCDLDEIQLRQNRFITIDSKNRLIQLITEE